MGLFSKLRGGDAAQSTQNEEIARGVLAMPFLVAASDGSVDKCEIDQILNMCAYSPIFHAVGADKTLALSKDIANQLHAEGATKVFARSAAALPAAQRETALCFAIRAALADGYVDQREKDMLVTMGEQLGVAPEKFMQIFEVMAMLQRPAAA